MHWQSFLLSLLAVFVLNAGIGSLLIDTALGKKWMDANWATPTWKRRIIRYVSELIFALFLVGGIFIIRQYENRTLSSALWFGILFGLLVSVPTMKSWLSMQREWKWKSSIILFLHRMGTSVLGAWLVYLIYR